MRICLHTIREISPGFIGGTERLMVEFAKELNLIGHDAFIVCSGQQLDLSIDGVSIVQSVPSAFVDAYRRHGTANSGFLNQVIMNGEINEVGLRALGEYVDAQLEEIQTDILHLNGFATSLFAKKAYNAVITNHENDREYDGTWGLGATELICSLARTQSATLANAAALTTPSHYYAEYYTRMLDRPVQPMKAGINLITFPNLRQAPAQNERGSRVTRILLPSRFDPHQKGHDLAILAAAILKDRGFSFEMTFSGVRPDYEKRVEPFRDRARSLGVLDRIVFKRFASMATAYANADVIISPERYCSYGLSISESLASGLPTVLSDIPTYREIAGGYTHALFFESEDAESLAAQIVAASQLELEHYDSEIVRFRIENDLRHMAVEYTAIYESLIHNRSAA
jgi:glycosyltransferase involved in cell wall biosynthesis